jgi:flavin-dependent dehydrogenase
MPSIPRVTFLFGENVIDNPQECEALIIGGGPAGSTIGALLAERGRHVVLMEKAKHPRFHIGESLLPLNLPLFERLGVDADMKRIGMPKYGAEFVSPWHGEPVTYDFADAMDKSLPVAYQVRRSEFDEILIRHAARKGATVIEECRVTAVEFNPQGARVTARQANGEEQKWQTRFVVDASGRDTVLANQFAAKRRNRKHNSAAIFGHFSDAARLPGKAEGNISLFWFDHGWFWFIPLADGATSVGAVCWPYYMKSRKSDPQRFFLETIALCPPLADRLRSARLTSPVTATGNYSYHVKRAAGERYLLLGDAFTFIDPVFSTGVLFAMHSGFVGADTVDTCLADPRKAARALKAFDASMHRGPKVFSWFIYRLTTPAFRDLFMRPRNQKLQEAVLSVLAGDVFRDTPFGGRLLVFKTLYYLRSAFSLRASFTAWRRRRQNVRSGNLGSESNFGPADEIRL